MGRLTDQRQTHSKWPPAVFPPSQLARRIGAACFHHAACLSAAVLPLVCAAPAAAGDGLPPLISGVKRAAPRVPPPQGGCVGIGV